MKSDLAPPWAAIASDTSIRAAAEEQLAAGGSAIEAVIAGWFAAAGGVSWAALAPLTIATAGGGGGARFIDGRARQPGLGYDRPVRYRSGETPPAVARAAAPGSIAAISVLAAISSVTRMSTLAARGITIAKEAGAKRRARFLGRVADGGSLALTERSFTDEIAAHVPRIDGGLLGPDDVREIRPDTDAGALRALGGHTARVPSWSEGESYAHLGAATAPRLTLLACDAHGGFAAVLIEPPPGGLAIYESEIELPLLAEPITKGVPRTKAGSPLSSPAPVAMVFDGDAPLALVASSSRHLDETLLADAHLLDDTQTIWLPPTLPPQATPATLYAVLRPKASSGRAITRRFDAPV